MNQSLKPRDRAAKKSRLLQQRRKLRRQKGRLRSRRAFLFQGTAMVACGAAMLNSTTSSGYAQHELEGLAVRPPTANKDDSVFQKQCIRCGLCGTVCENGCIRFFGLDEDEHGAFTPYLDVRRRSCTLCMRCTQICPTNALQPVEDRFDEIKKLVSMGTARVERDMCLSYLGRVCGYCHDVCPLPQHAIKLTPPALPVILDGCVGCGRCVEFCPQSPTAITLIPASQLTRRQI